MTNRRSFIRTVGLATCTVLLAVVGLTGCAGKSVPPAAGETAAPAPVNKVEKVRIGTLQPLTGSNAFPGTQIKHGIEIAAEKVNQAGGIKSLGGAKIELVSADTQGKPEVGAAEAERLITRENVAALIGAFQSAVTVTTTQVAEKHQVVHMIDEGISAEILARGFKYSFRTIADATIASKNTVKYVVDLAKATNTKLETVVVLHENTAFGTSMMNVIKTEAPLKGLQVLDVIGYSPAATDLTTEVSKALQKKPDVILWSGYFNDGVLGARAFSQLKGQSTVKAVIGNTNGAFSTDKFVADVGAVSEFFFDNNHRWNVKSPHLAYIMEELTKRNAPITHDVIDGYAAAMVLFDAIERAGSVDREKIREAVAKTSLKLDILPQIGPVEFDATGQNKNANTLLTQIQGTKIINVHPSEYAEGKPTMNWAK